MTQHPNNNGSREECGACFWHEPMENGRAIQCWHDPPVVFPSGFVDNPKVGRGRRACAQFKAITEPTKEQVIKEGAAAAAALVASGRIAVKAGVNMSEGPRGKRNG